MIERRSLTAHAGTGPRAAAGVSAKRIGGLAIPYNVPARIGGVFDEVWLPGCFDAAEADGWEIDPDQRGYTAFAAYLHDFGIMLGSVQAGTLQLSQTRAGLNYVLEPPTAAAWVVELVERGDVAGTSISFTIDPDGQEWVTQADGTPLRKVRSARLWEVSPVYWPAFTTTTCTPLLGPRRSLPAPPAARGGGAAVRDLHRVMDADLAAWRARERLLIEGGIDARDVCVRRLAGRPA